MEKINIGKVVNVVGLRGEIKIYNYSDTTDRYLKFKEIIIGEKTFNIDSVRVQKNMIIMKLQGITKREEAEALKEQLVYITEAQLEQLPEDTYYVKDLIGLTVKTVEGEEIGKVKDVIQNGGCDIYDIQGAKGQIMIPAVKEFIKSVSMEEQTIIVSLIEGMM